MKRICISPALFAAIVITTVLLTLSSVFFAAKRKVRGIKDGAVGKAVDMVRDAVSSRMPLRLGNNETTTPTPNIHR